MTEGGRGAGEGDLGVGEGPGGGGGGGRRRGGRLVPWIPRPKIFLAKLEMQPPRETASKISILPPGIFNVEPPPRRHPGVLAAKVSDFGSNLLKCC